MYHSWGEHLTRFDEAVLALCGSDGLSSTINPLTRALKSDSGLVEQVKQIKGYSMSAMSRLATLCQMSVYDAHRGPEGDRDEKALRRHWYAWYKVDFVQPFSAQLNEGEFDGGKWAALLSVTYAKLVDEENITYKQLWVKDASRMMEHFYDKLFDGCHILIAVEKDSLFADFKSAAKALGAAALISGKGKNSKAAAEKLLRDFFGWNENHDPFSSDQPLIVLHLSDHDFDGEAVIGPTFAEQMRRYTPHILEARIGVRPEQVDESDWQDKWYDVKVNNTGYVDWAADKALFLAECATCGKQWPQIGATGHCPECGSEVVLTVRDGTRIVDQPFGFEVEALPTRTYYKLIVKALLQVLPFRLIVEKLREECVASSYDAAARITEEVLANNKSYQDLLREFERLELVKSEFEQRVKDQLQAVASPHEADWSGMETDPEPEDFEEWVKKADSWSGPWRPFSQQLRTDRLTKYVKEEFSSMIDEFSEEKLEL